jgi:Fe-S cluster assembly protein SufD
MIQPANQLPSNRDENWRYANLRPLAKALIDDARAPLGNFPTPLPPALEGHERWVFHDGHFAASDAATDERVRLLDARVAGASFAALLDADLASAGIDFALARINAARGDDVVQIELPDDSKPLNIELVFYALAPAANGTSYPRVQLIAGRNTRVRLIERHLTSGDSAAAVNAAFDIALRPGARLDHVRVQDCSAATTIFDTLVAQVGDAAEYKLCLVTLGGLSSRSTAFIKLAGRQARCELSAASVATGTQTHDIFAEIEHVGAESVTRELFRGIANDRGKLAFNGKMIVRDSARDADSDQSLKTLLAGNGAEAAARPQLEIYTDRVRAKHGATTGKLDEQMMFYLLSRGIDRPTAQTLLQWAFIEDAVSKIGLPALRGEIERLIAARLLEVAALDGLLAKP